MKKTLLLFLVAGVWVGSQAQNTTAVGPKLCTASLRTAAIAKYKASLQENPSAPTARKTTKNHKIGAAPALVQLGSSYNVNTSRYTPSTQLTANQACGLIVMTHRADNSKFANVGSGAYEVAYSTNAGASWDTNTVMNANEPTRYPNGALFNPVGNTNPQNVYDAYMGAWNNGSTTALSWTATDYGSVTIAGTNLHTMYWQNSGGPAFNQDGGTCIGYESSSDDSTVHGIGEGWTYNVLTPETWTGAVLTTGKFNSVTDSFNWTQTLFRPHLVPALKGFATNNYPYDSMAFPLGQPGTAWSQDGKTGYVIIFGNLDSAGYNYTSYQPIVYRTGDAGKTWAMMPMFNFRNCPNLTTYLYPTADSGIKTPIWDLYTYYGGANDVDYTVDYKGNLHIMGTIISQYYTNPDSAYDLSWYRGQHGYIYDVYNTTPTGGWNARYIDSMRTYPTNIVTASFSNDWDQTSTGYVSMENRMQASRTTDGKHIFCTWVDDTSAIVNFGFDSIVNPDVKSEGYNVVTGKSGPPSTFTSTGNNYFLSVSDIVMTSGTPDTTYTIPCTIVYPQLPPDDGTTAVDHYYLPNVKFTDSLNNASVATIAKQGFSISQNYPNPFSNLTNFNINLSTESLVSVDVYNLVGQKVYSIPAQKMSLGTHLMTINANGWSSGVYFYRVTANDNSITQKMIVQ